MSPTTRRTFLAHSAACAGYALSGCRAASATDTEPNREVSARSALLSAVLANEPERVRALLTQQPALVNAQDEEGRSALVLALRDGHRAVADVLLAAKPEIGLVEAVMIPDWEQAEAFAKADPSALDKWHPVGGSSLYAAARAGHADLWRLQSWGADTNGSPHGADGVTPAYGALECPAWNDAMRSTVALLSNAGDVNAAQRGGDSLLHLAARRGDPYLVRYLVRRGARVEALDANGETAEVHAERAGHGKIVELLRNASDLPVDDETNRYAFDASGGAVVWPDLSDLSLEVQWSVTGPSHWNLPRVRELVDAEPRLAFTRSSQNELGVEAAAHTGNRPCMRYHLDRGAPQSVATSISIGDLGRARDMLERHPDSIHERGPHDFALMWYAAIGGGSVEAAELLLDFGADPDQESEGTTALHRAAERGHRDLVRFLLDAGADPNAVGYKTARAGQTPVQAARARGQEAAARLIVEHGGRG